MKQKFDIHSLSPAQILSLGYLIIIVVGTGLLSLPIATIQEGGMNVLDALFTATSATAVTGLIVENTAEFFTTFGQAVIMFLIQIGGLGLMTMATLFALLVGREITLKERLIIQEDLDQFKLAGLIKLVKYVVTVALSIEAVGAFLLFLRFVQDMPVGRALYFGIFHSISAFNNAGFDIFGNSLENFTGDIVVNLVITSLFIIGGIGFAVIAQVYNNKRNFKKFSLHTKMVLSITAILIIAGMLVAFTLEYNNPETLGQLTLGEKTLASYFLAVTPRTAGFNTVPTGGLRSSTLLFMIILMFIGASPGSTGGGIKTTTFGVLGAVLYARVVGRDDIEVFKRRLDKNDIYNAISIVFIAMLLVLVVTMLLNITEQAEFLALLFEAVSAFGTVGLSTGITGGLSRIGRVLIIITMFAGRVGPLTIIVAIAQRKAKANYKYAKERILVG
ncbi:TrkH family potassium uptake protein [Natroniella acetigena]|uniref:TrkH family potassium uptake protein n=1 Tax=Natroniella acetigena TaxID=52004 RepID=UPI00200AD7C8|nr:TrkH family potassium uptake protein [Natroniella acetigena]MCK8827918.1 TrkH family potassium uptake protein [Natroniella acetigena]